MHIIMSEDELNQLLESAFGAARKLYKERGFQRRIGFGENPALINVDLANAWTRPGNPFTCEGMDDRVIPGVQRLLAACREQGHPVIHVTTCYQNTDRSDPHTRRHLRESPWVVTGPLLALAVPSIIAGFLLFEPVLSGELLGGAIHIDPQHDAVAKLAAGYDGKQGFALILSALVHGVSTAPFWLAVAGTICAWYGYRKKPELPGKIAAACGPLYRIVQNKYGFDDLYQAVFARGSLRLGNLLSRRIDAGLIDDAVVNNSARVVRRCAGVMRKAQTGFTHHYAFAMIIGLFCLITLFVWL